MIGVVTFNGQRSDDLGLKISGYHAFNGPERIYETFHVPGRNGDLLIDSGSFKNIEIEYEASVVNFSREKAIKIREWLLSPIGYCKLEDSYNNRKYDDSYDTATFRLAKYIGPIEFEDFTQLLRDTHVLLRFTCKPQRYLESGEFWKENPTELENKTVFPSKPLLELKATGNSSSVTIGDCTISFPNMSGKTIFLDAETLDAVGPNGENFNENITITNELIIPPRPERLILNRPDVVLPNGKTVSVTRTECDVKIKPRWWFV